MEKDKVIVKCAYCGADIQVMEKTVKRKMKKGGDWKCIKCIGKENSERYKNLPEEEKERRRKMVGEISKNAWSKLTLEEKRLKMDNLNNGFKKYHENKTPEQKAELSKKVSESVKRHWENVSEEEKARIVAPMKQKSLENYHKLSPEEKKKRHDVLQAGNMKWWKNASEEEKDIIRKIRSDASREYWDNLTEEEMDKVRKARSESMQARWDRMTPEEYEEWDKKRREGLDKYLDDLDVKLNESETEFLNMFKLEGLNPIPRWYNYTRHEDFGKLFPFNHVTGESRISPYHQWDFMIPTKESLVLVDVDGSIHDPKSVTHEITTHNGKKVKLADVVAFNDSQRPYQRDGLPAYAILCYNDKPDKNTPVKNIVTGEILTVDALLATLSWMNKTESEKREILDLAFSK